MVLFGSQTLAALHSHICVTVNKSKFSPAGYRLVSSFFEYVCVCVCVGISEWQKMGIGLDLRFYHIPYYREYA
jgi:TRAP-type C4-dicarboxylate transport system permease small subunit